MAQRSDEVGHRDARLTDLGLFHDRRQSFDAFARRLGRLLVRKRPAQNHHLDVDTTYQQTTRYLPVV